MILRASKCKLPRTIPRYAVAKPEPYQLGEQRRGPSSAIQLGARLELTNQ